MKATDPESHCRSDLSLQELILIRERALGNHGPASLLLPASSRFKVTRHRCTYILTEIIEPDSIGGDFSVMIDDDGEFLQVLMSL